MIRIFEYILELFLSMYFLRYRFVHYFLIPIDGKRFIIVICYFIINFTNILSHLGVLRFHIRTVLFLVSQE